MKLLSVWRNVALLITLTFCTTVWAGTVTWIDVRTPEEFSQKHVPDAQNIPYDQIDSKIANLGLQKDQVIYLYCGSGRRAGIAKQTLDSLGYTHVVNIGGLDDALAKVAEINQQ